MWPACFEKQRGQVGKGPKGISHKKAVGKAFSVKWHESNRVGWQGSMVPVTWEAKEGHSLELRRL